MAGTSGSWSWDSLKKSPYFWVILLVVIILVAVCCYYCCYARKDGAYHSRNELSI